MAKRKERKADYMILDADADNLVQDTTVKEKFRVFRISQRIGKYFSELLFGVGAISIFLSAQYFLGAELLAFELKNLFLFALGFIGTINLVAGLLLLSKE